MSCEKMPQWNYIYEAILVKHLKIHHCFTAYRQACQNVPIICTFSCHISFHQLSEPQGTLTIIFNLYLQPLAWRMMVHFILGLDLELENHQHLMNSYKNCLEHSKGNVSIHQLQVLNSNIFGRHGAVSYSLPPPFSPSYKHLQVSISIYVSDGHAVVELGGVIVIVGMEDALGDSWEHGLRSLSWGDGRQEQNQQRQHPHLKGRKRRSWRRSSWGSLVLRQMKQMNCFQTFLMYRQDCSIKISSSYEEQHCWDDRDFLKGLQHTSVLNKSTLQEIVHQTLLNTQKKNPFWDSRLCIYLSAVLRYKEINIPPKSAAFCRVRSQKPITDRQAEKIKDRKSIRGQECEPEAKWALRKYDWISDLRCCIRDSDQLYTDKVLVFRTYCIVCGTVHTGSTLWNAVKVWMLKVKKRKNKVTSSSSTAVQNLTQHTHIKCHLQADSLICFACGFMTQPSTK